MSRRLCERCKMREEADTFEEVLGVEVCGWCAEDMTYRIQQIMLNTVGWTVVSALSVLVVITWIVEAAG